MTRLVVEGVTAGFTLRPVLNDVGITLDGGELVGIVGPNGAGKTSLLKVCLGLLKPQHGKVTIDGASLYGIKRQDLARTVSYLPQSSISHWPLEVSKLVQLGRIPHLAPWQQPGRSDADAVEAALDLADVRHLVGRNVLELSGGERARVLLARTLAVGGQLLLADEPVAGLDPEHQLKIMQVFQQQAAAGTGVMLTLHDLSLAARYCHRIIMLCDGRVVENGTPEVVLTAEKLASVFRIRATIGIQNGHRYVVPMDTVCPDPDRATG